MRKLDQDKEVLMRAGQIIRTTIISLAFATTTQAALWFKIPNANEEIKQFGKASKEELDPHKIEVMIWNQYKGKERSYRREYQRLGHGKDVLILQEAVMDKKMSQIFSSQRDIHTIFASSFVYRLRNKATGVASAARVKASSYLAQRSRGKEIVGSTPKMVLFATYPLKGRSDELMTVNIHALNSVTWQTLAVQILDALKVVNAHEGPVVFGGDFNTWSKKKLEYVFHAMKKAGLEEVKFAHAERKMKVFGRELDHAFTRGLKISNAIVEKTDGADHQPLLLRAQVR